MDEKLVQEETFHIGLTMAGAVSAGCYTAGVMDYLFEILEVWENAKAGELPSGWNKNLMNFIPRHDVVIDVMGGASAGGMTTMMSAIYAMKGKINPVNNPYKVSSIKDNILYDSWVLMGDHENSKEKVFEKSLSLKDLEEDKIISLLNSDFIDEICDNAFIDDVGSDKKLPKYISVELEVLLSQTMLRNVPLPMDFSTPFGSLKKRKENPKYNTFEHFVISHFKLDYDENNPLHKDFYLPLAPFSSQKEIVDRLKLTTKATGAFPIGLSFRKFFNNEFTVEYIKNNSRKLLHDKIQPENIPTDPPIDFEDVADPFNFVGVDGGAINNEPIGEVLNVLKERYGEKKEGEYDKFGLIMIDPFPNHIYNDEYSQPEDVFSVIPSILGTLQDQARIKRREMLEFHTEKYLRGEIYPVRYTKEHKLEQYHIACSSVFAFGGFLDISFRHHDFFLGRDNARNFFKVYFSFEYDPDNNNIHPIHRNWTIDMINAFKFKREGKYFLPIIPNLFELKDKFDKVDRNPYERTVKNWPQYDANKLLQLSDKMEARVKKIIELTYKKITDSKEDNNHPKTNYIVQKYYRENIFTRFSGWIGSKTLSIIFQTNKNKIARKISKALIEKVLKDLEEKMLLK